MTVQLENVADIYSLSPMQEGMLYHTVAEPGSGVFVSQVVSKIDGHLDVEAFKSAWETLVQRHESLRSAVVWEGLEDPVQVIRGRASLEWTRYDWSQDSQCREKLEDFLARDRERGFDMTSAPLMRMSVIRLDEVSWRWVWTCHHIICDGWSAQILLGELRSLYKAHRAEQPQAAILPPPFPYKDYLTWRARRDAQEDERYWRARLEGFTEPHRLEVPGLPPGQESRRYRTYTLALDGGETSAIATASSAMRVTTNAFVLAAWSVVLSSWLRTRDLVLGVTTSGRSPELSGIEKAVGLFINTLPLRLDVAPEISFEELGRSAASEQLLISEREHVPLNSVQRWSEVPPGQPLFESIFVFENFPDGPPVEATDLSISHVAIIEQSNYPLAVLVHPGTSMRVSFVFDSSALSEDAVASLGSQLALVLRQAAEAPATTISSLRLTGDAEDEELTALACGPPLIVSERTILEAIEEVAEEDPDAIAVADEESALSYRDLVTNAQELAARLRSSGVRKDSLVGLLMPRRVDFVTGIIAILKSGGAYVPLDPEYPRAHIGSVLEQEGIHVVLTDSTHGAWLPAEVGRILVDDGAANPHPIREWERVEPDHRAYVIHTSGSSAKPKGVMVSHKNLLASTSARTGYYGGPVEAFLLLSSFAFDSSIAGIFWTLTSGGKLAIPPAGIEQDMGRLLAFAASNEVTHLLALPSLYEIMLEEANAGELDSLRVAIVAGEACPPDLITTHAARLPQTQLHNEYGPTEATVWCAAHRIQPEDSVGPVPIGRPIPGAQTFVLDQRGHQTPLGFPGEIYIGGAGVAQGYLNQPELTRSSFQMAFVGGADRQTYRTGDLACFDRSGRLLFLGRADSQVKVRGHRVELTAIESAIRSVETVDDIVVRAVPAPNGKTNRLIAYAVRADGGSDLVIRDRLRDTLPAFMVPDVVIELEAIPRVPNGKVDTNGLPHPEEEGRGRREPETEPELILAGIWRELLGVEEVGVDDDYFELGGDSLQSIRLFSRIEAETGVSLPLNALLNNPTILQLARLIDHGEADSPRDWRSLVPIRAAGAGPPFACVHAGGGRVLFYRHLAALLPAQSPVYGLEPIGLDGSAKPIDNVEEMAALYVSELRQVQPKGPYRLIGYCMGGVVSLEMARQLEADDQAVELLIVVDSGIARDPFGSSHTSKIRREYELGGMRGLVSFLGQRLVDRSHRSWNLLFGEPEAKRTAIGSLVQRASRRALQNYSPAGIKASILLIRSTEYAELDDKDWHMNWGELSPDLRIKVVEAEHLTILERPDSVAQVAQAIHDGLESGR